MASKMCPSCSVENNPSFSQCWKCGLVFNTGEKAPLPNRNAEMADRWWPAMTSITVAEQATKSAFGAAMVSAALTAILALLPLFGKSYLGFNLSNLVDVFLILALGYGVKKNNRACAVLLLAYFIAGRLYFLVERPGNSGTHIISGIIWGLFYVNGVRGAFAYHKLNQGKITQGQSKAKISVALISLILALSSALLMVISFFSLDLISFQNETSGLLLIGGGLFFISGLIFAIVGLLRKESKKLPTIALIILALTLIASLSFSGHVRSSLIKETPQHQEAQWKQMTAEARAYYESNEYEKGVEASKKALRFAETAFGNAHPYVATSVNNLAEFYRGQKKYAEAEALCKRSISVLEMAFEPNHYTMSMPLNTLGLIYADQGKNEAAELSFKRAIELAQKSPKPDEKSINQMVANLESIKSLKK